MQNLRRNVMRSVKIDKKKLLGIVRENKEKHIVAFNESVEDFKALAIKITAANLELANSGDLAKISKAKSIPQAPTSHEKEYERAIRMLELSVEKEIEVEEDIFNQLVLDEWAWKNQFVASSALYKTM
jgi:hypothetical protein